MVTESISSGSNRFPFDVHGGFWDHWVWVTSALFYSLLQLLFPNLHHSYCTVCTQYIQEAFHSSTPAALTLLS